jgi:hypothetical protein
VIITVTTVRIHSCFFQRNLRRSTHNNENNNNNSNKTLLKTINGPRNCFWNFDETTSASSLPD